VKKVTRTRTAAQNLWVEVWHDDRRLEYYVVQAGATVNFYETDGFWTKVEPHALRLDTSVAGIATDTITEGRRQQAIFRLERASADGGNVELVYGPMFTDPVEG
jgi:hypothetical protein